MSPSAFDTEQLARDLLAVSTDAVPDSATVTAVRRQLDTVRHVLRFDAANAPSDAALRRAVGIFRPAAARQAPPVTARLRALLTFDSRTVRPSFGFRGGSAATMLRYEVDGILIDLEIRRATPTNPDRLEVTGGIDGATTGPIRVELRTREGACVGEGVQDELGSFTLTAAPSIYDLVARFGTTELTVPAITVG